MSPDAVDREIADHCRAFQATCQLRFIARAVSGGLLDDRCQQEGCAMWSGARKCCGLIRGPTNDREENLSREVLSGHSDLPPGPGARG
jgi:hypothetical protein